MKILIVDRGVEINNRTADQFAALGHEVRWVAAYWQAKEVLASSAQGEWDVLLADMVQHEEEHLLGSRADWIGFPLCVQAALKGVRRAAVVGELDPFSSANRVMFNVAEADEDPEQSLFGFYPDFTINDLRCLFLSKPPLVSRAIRCQNHKGDSFETEDSLTDWYGVFCHLYPEDFPRETITDSA